MVKVSCGDVIKMTLTHTPEQAVRIGIAIGLVDAYYDVVQPPRNAPLVSPRLYDLTREMLGEWPY